MVFLTVSFSGKKDPRLFMEGVMKISAKFFYLFENCFQKDHVLHQAFEKGCRSFINRGDGDEVLILMSI